MSKLNNSQNENTKKISFSQILTDKNFLKLSENDVKKFSNIFHPLIVGYTYFDLKKIDCHMGCP